MITHHVVNLLRMVEIPEHVAIERVLRLGRWEEGSDSRCRDPRPTLVEFTNRRCRGRFLASSYRVETITGGEITIEPGDTTISKVRARAASRDRQGSIPRG